MSGEFLLLPLRTSNVVRTWRTWLTWGGAGGPTCLRGLSFQDDRLPKAPRTAHTWTRNTELGEMKRIGSLEQITPR